MLTSFLLEFHSMKIIVFGNATLDTSKDLTFLGGVVCNAAAFVMLDSIEDIVTALQMVSVYCAPTAL